MVFLRCTLVLSLHLLYFIHSQTQSLELDAREPYYDFRFMNQPTTTRRDAQGRQPGTHTTRGFLFVHSRVQ